MTPAHTGWLDMYQALKKIADNYGGCRCDHTSPECCENPCVDEFCPHCIAELAIAKAEGRILTAPTDPNAVALGRKGGQAKSDAKTAAVRENGKKGGRPRKPKSYLIFRHFQLQHCIRLL